MDRRTLAVTAARSWRRLPCLALAGALAACGGGSSGDDAGPPRDAHTADTTAAMDATMDAPSTDTAPQPDAATDGPALDTSMPDAPDTTDAPLPDAPAPDAASAPNPMGPTGTWHLLFDDEFDGAALDGTKWNSGWYTTGTTASSPPVQATEQEYYSPDGIVFPGDGAVHLRLSAAGHNSYGKPYQSGMIQSSNRFTFDPSAATTVLEARIKVPGPNARAGGYWPAFWLLSNQDAAGGAGTWPPEIDLFEFFGNSTMPEAHLHTTGGDINYGEDDSDGSTDLSLAFHVYTLELSTHALTFYLDGTQRWTYTNAANIARVLSPAPLYVLLNMQFGGAAGSPTGAVPADLVIDYVRAWTAP